MSDDKLMGHAELISDDDKLMSDDDKKQLYEYRNTNLCTELTPETNVKLITTTSDGKNIICGIGGKKRTKRKRKRNKRKKTIKEYFKKLMKNFF